MKHCCWQGGTGVSPALTNGSASGHEDKQGLSHCSPQLQRPYMLLTHKMFVLRDGYEFGSLCVFLLKKKTPFTLQEILISRNNISFSWRTRCDRQANGDGGQVPVTVPVTCPLLRHGHLAQPWVHRNNMEMWRRGRKSAMFDPSADHRSCSSLRTSEGPLSYPRRP